MSQQLRGRLEALLARLEDAATRSSALAELHRLRREPGDPAFQVRRFELSTSVLEVSLDLLLVPSIFEPEDWSYTFLEGLLRYPSEALDGRSLVELGCGSGWVSLALLKATRLGSIVALDLNPVAVLVAQINALLNSYDELGQPLPGPILAERIQVRESDLLRSMIQRSQRFDFVVGCIPQVLSPNPDFDPTQALSELDEQRLYDLSNYFALQGVYEDQFGLGLLARALEQAVLVLAPAGKVILNVAGRPGAKVIESMFARRGFQLREVWTRRVKQAEDTDIGVLAELEQRTGNAFEFFVGATSHEPVGAHTAHALRGAGMSIWHDLRVIEATLLFEQQLRPFYHAMLELGYQAFLDQLDLSAISEEQVTFLRSLAQGFTERKTAPYTDACGGEALRRGIARYLQRQFELDVQSSQLFVAPSRQELLYGIVLCCLEAGERVVVSASLAQAYGQPLGKAGVEVLVGNDDLDELTEIADALNPKMVLLALETEERRNIASLTRLAERARAAGRLVVVDASEDFEITSGVHANPLLECFATSLSSIGVLVLTGLIKNRVYPGLAPAFLVGPDKNLLVALEAFAESTYSRVDSFTERYYTALFDEILAFQLRRLGQPNPSLRPQTGAADEGRFPLSQSMRRTLSLPAFTEPEYQGTALRLDYGENELDMPDRLVQGLLLGFTNLSSDVSDQRLAELVAAFELERSGEAVDATQVVLGNGVFPLLADAALALRKRLGRAPRIAIAAGHYGYLPPVFTLAGCDVVQVPGAAEQGFMLNAAELGALSERPDALLIVNPNNPTGVFAEQAQLDEVVAYAVKHDVLVLSDEIFSGIDLEGSDQAPRVPSDAARILRFNGLSKMFAAGGLRVGWAYGTDRELLSAMRPARLTSLARHSRIATEVLLRGFAAGGTQLQSARQMLDEHLEIQRLALRAQRQRLEDCLRKSGAECSAGRPGGLFIFADVRSWEGREMSLPGGQQVTLTQENIPRILEAHFGLRVNSGTWARAPGYIRLCYSLTPERFSETLVRLEHWKRALGAGSSLRTR